MDDKDPAIREFVQRLTGCQAHLYAYIMTLLLDANRADDVLQQTNLVIWEKIDEFVGVDNFEARACKVAYYQVLASRRDASREHGRLLFDDTVLENVAQAASRQMSRFDGYLSALRDCVSRLSKRQRELIRLRYMSGGSVNAIAAERSESPDATSALLYRIRKKLLACIQYKIPREQKA